MIMSIIEKLKAIRAAVNNIWFVHDFSFHTGKQSQIKGTGYYTPMDIAPGESAESVMQSVKKMSK